MASLMRPLLNRSLIASFRNTNLLSAIAVRNKATNTPTTGDSSSLAKPLEKKAVDPTADPKESYLADPWDILYGAERFEIAMKTKGYDDPYDMEPMKRKAVSTKQDPNIVLTLSDDRIVGCVCEEDTHRIEYMFIGKGETKRCECGHWFKCVERELPDLSEFGVHVQKGHH